jgi:hypothetical protein
MRGAEFTIISVSRERRSLPAVVEASAPAKATSLRGCACCAGMITNLCDRVARRLVEYFAGSPPASSSARGALVEQFIDLYLAAGSSGRLPF